MAQVIWRNCYAIASTIISISLHAVLRRLRRKVNYEEDLSINVSSMVSIISSLRHTLVPCESLRFYVLEWSAIWDCNYQLKTAEIVILCEKRGHVVGKLSEPKNYSDHDCMDQVFNFMDCSAINPLGVNWGNYNRNEGSQLWSFWMATGSSDSANLMFFLTTHARTLRLLQGFTVKLFRRIYYFAKPVERFVEYSIFRNGWLTNPLWKLFTGTLGSALWCKGSLAIQTLHVEHKRGMELINYGSGNI